MRKNKGFKFGYACEMRLVSSKVERNSKLSTARVQNKPTSYELLFLFVILYAGICTFLGIGCASNNSICFKNRRESFCRILFSAICKENQQTKTAVCRVVRFVCKFLKICRLRSLVSSSLASVNSCWVGLSYSKYCIVKTTQRASEWLNSRACLCVRY